MTGEAPESFDVTPPTDWQPEAYPTLDREWLKASFVSLPMGVAISVLVADPLEEDTNAPVYPIAVTTDANEVVYKRHYEVFNVTESPSEAEDSVRETMDSISTEFAHGSPEFVSEGIQGISYDGQPKVQSTILESLLS